MQSETSKTIVALSQNMAVEVRRFITDMLHNGCAADEVGKAIEFLQELEAIPVNRRQEIEDTVSFDAAFEDIRKPLPPIPDYIRQTFSEDPMSGT